jgi:hypothetical protein
MNVNVYRGYTQRGIRNNYHNLYTIWRPPFYQPIHVWAESRTIPLSIYQTFSSLTISSPISFYVLIFLVPQIPAFYIFLIKYHAFSSPGLPFSFSLHTLETTGSLSILPFSYNGQCRDMMAATGAPTPPWSPPTPPLCSRALSSDTDHVV